MEDIPEQAMGEVVAQEGLASLRGIVDPQDPDCPVKEFIGYGLDRVSKRVRLAPPPDGGPAQLPFENED